MRDEDHGAPCEGSPRISNEAAFGFWVEHRGRFIEHDYSWIMQNCLGDTDTLLVALGEVADQSPTNSAQTTALAGTGYAGTALVAKGYVQASDIEPVVGALLTIGSVMWSVADKRKPQPTIRQEGSQPDPTPT